MLNATVPPLDPSFNDKCAIHDDKAFKETKAMSDDSLLEECQKNKTRRSERFKDHFEILILVVLWAIIAIVAVMALTWLYHMLSPLKWHWLEQENIDHLQTMLVGGVGGIVSTLASKNLKERLD